MKQKHKSIHGALRATLIIGTCMVIAKLFDFDSPVYLALYPTIAVTKGKDFSWVGLAKLFAPTLVSAASALFIVELFQDHPFVVWTISLFFFDWMRKKADTPAKRGALIMPLFNWILIIVFSQTTTLDMPGRIHEVLLSMLITSVIAKIVIYFFPIDKSTKTQGATFQPVSSEHRLVSLTLIGAGLACLMIADLLPATFCMVPVIIAATQPDRVQFLNAIKGRFITQVGGCGIAAIFSVFMAGHQYILSYYAIGLAAIIFSIAYCMSNSSGTKRDMHSDALLAAVTPIQLYMSSTDLGLESIALRAWQMIVTLFLLWLIYQLTQPNNDNDPKHYCNT